MKLYFNPLSTYSQKVLIALYEKGIEFEPEIVNLFSPEGKAEYKKISPIGKVPLMILPEKDGWQVPESTSIIEYLDQKYDEQPKLIPSDPDAARQTRFFDRMNDLYVANSFGTIFFGAMKPADKQDAEAIAGAKEKLDICYGHLDTMLEKNTWLGGDAFTMADCSLIPSLGYLRQTYPFEKYKNLTAYWNRAAERPSVARVLKEAEPWLAKMMG